MKRLFVYTLYSLLILTALISQETQGTSSLLFISPIGWPKDSEFNTSKIIEKYKIDLHVQAANNADIFAYQNGTVTKCDTSEDGKKRIKVISDTGLLMVYSGLEKLFVKEKEHIKRAQKIGTLDNDGKGIMPIFLLINSKIFNTLSKYSDVSFKTVIPKGSPVFASMNGQVKALGYDEVYGRGNNLELSGEIANFSYSNLNLFKAYRDKYVYLGDIIAYSGETGSVLEPSFSMELINTRDNMYYYIIYVVINDDAF